MGWDYFNVPPPPYPPLRPRADAVGLAACTPCPAGAFLPYTGAKSFIEVSLARAFAFLFSFAR